MKKRVQSEVQCRTYNIYPLAFFYVFIAVNLFVKTQFVICRLKQRLVQNVSVLMKISIRTH